MGFHTPPFFLLVLAAFVLFWASKGHKLMVLAVFNCLFYLYAGPLDFGLCFSAAVMGYLTGLGMQGRHKKLWAILGSGAILVNLIIFKYYYFIIGNISKIAHVPAGFVNLRIVLPIGISFYTFQLIAYLIDVYRDEVTPITSFIKFWVFISFFAQVIAGPIMRAKDFAPQVANTGKFNLDFQKLKNGMYLFSMGLIKKLVFADTLALLADNYFAKGISMSSVDIWIGAYLFAFQIYFDFSAYSDMALGIGQFFGYKLTRNFNTPYLSQNPPEFWKRWHITLSSWVRDYLYIPMGGSRKGFTRGIYAIIAAMCISGLWHGASWNFVLWGLYHGLLSVVHRLWKKKKRDTFDKNKVLHIFNTLLFFNLTVIGWVFFRVSNIRDIGILLRKMLFLTDLSHGPHFMHYVFLIAGLYFLHLVEFLILKHWQSLKDWWDTCVPPQVKGLVYACVFLVVCIFLRPAVNAFIYFRF